MKLKLITDEHGRIVLVTAPGDVIDGVASVKFEVLPDGKTPVLKIELLQYDIDIKK